MLTEIIELFPASVFGFSGSSTAFSQQKSVLRLLGCQRLLSRIGGILRCHVHAYYSRRGTEIVVGVCGTHTYT